MPVIPALQRQGQEGWEFKANLRFTVIPLFQKTKTGIVVHASDPSTHRIGHLENCSDFEASLCYIRNPKPTNKTKHTHASDRPVSARTVTQALLSAVNVPQPTGNPGLHADKG